MIYLIEFRAMGCQVSIQLDTHVDGGAILSRAPAQVAALETRLTRFNDHSELMRLNARAGEWTSVSDILFDNIHAAKYGALLTDGLYNPLILPALIANGYDRTFEQINPVTAKSPLPAANWREISLRLQTHQVRIPAGSAIDLGGIAKGWTAAYIAGELAQYGACLINIGGDMVGRGAPEGFTGWPVEIEDPVTGTPFASIYLTDSTIVTSGTDYRRWLGQDGRHRHHIIDPRTGQSSNSDALAVTIIHPHTTTAEAFTKAVLIRGTDDGLNWLNQQWHAGGLVFRRDGSVLATSTFSTLIHERELQT